MGFLLGHKWAFNGLSVGPLVGLKWAVRGLLMGR